MLNSHFNELNMKNILTILSIFILFSACGKLEDLNKNTKDPSSVPGESLFTYAQKKLCDQMTTPNVNNNIFRLITQQWTETTYTDESNYDLVTRTIPDLHWNHLYRDVLKNFKEASKVVEATTYPITENPSIKKNKLAIIDILTVYTYGVLVQTFGDIPYTEALDLNKPLPKYDDGLTVCKDLLSRLNTAINTLSDADSNESFGLGDNIYQGDVTLWIKFANSLKLRMGMVLADVDASAKQIVEAAALNVFTSNSDNAKLIYLSANPNTNPVYTELVASGRHDFVPTNTLVDIMNNLDDPRRYLYFIQMDTSSTDVPKFAFVGGENGASNNYYTNSHIADALNKPTFPATFFDYSEVEFLLAEAVERGYNVGGTAEEHYNKAIEASISDWGSTDVNLAKYATKEVINTYLANPMVAYSTAEGDFKQKIGVQSWIALYNRGLEAWTQWRRLDYPVLVAPADAVSDVPVRYIYPIQEQTLNGANYKAASDKIGGDNVSTKLFWDKN
jgi:hypothetical protein